MANEKIEALMAKARAAQALVANYTQEQADDMVRVVAHKVWDDRENIARIAVEDTGKGTFEFKMGKLRATISGTYQYLKGRKTVGLIEENEEKQLKTYAKPIGVLACISPVTNPAATPIGNGLNVLKTRNAMIVSPHPGAKIASGYTVNLMREALKENGYPEDLIQIVPDGTMQDTSDLMAAVDLIVATGGPGMVKSALSSGKPSLGVGAGNAQCIIDEDYEDVESIVDQIIETRMIDFGMPCTGEQTIHCPKDKVDAVVAAYKARKAHYIDDPEELQKIRETAFVNGAINRYTVGQRSHKVCELAGIEIPEDTTILLLKVDACGEDEVLAGEILFPTTRIYAYDNFEQAIERAKANLAIAGAGHSSCLWSNNDEHIDYAARKLQAGRIMINQPATCGSGRQFNGLPQTVSLGCGYWGGNSVYQNVNYKQMLNYTIVSKIVPGKKVLTPEEIMAD